MPISITSRRGNRVIYYLLQPSFGYLHFVNTDDFTIALVERFDDDALEALLSRDAMVMMRKSLAPEADATHRQIDRRLRDVLDRAGDPT